MEQKRIRQQAHASNPSLPAAVATDIEDCLTYTSDSVIAFDLEGKILAANEKAALLLDRKPKDLVSHYVWELIQLNLIRMRRQFIEALRCFSLAKSGLAQEFTWLEYNHSKPSLAYNVMINKAELHGTPVVFTKIIEILSAKPASQNIDLFRLLLNRANLGIEHLLDKKDFQSVITLAYLDGLTEIPNRQYFEKKFPTLLEEHRHETKEMAVLLIDLDDFKTINDTLGHSVGDKLLKAATKRMVRCLRQKDFIARVGGDEFVVLLNECNIQAAEKVAKKIASVLERFFQFGAYKMHISSSIGIAIFPDSGTTPTELLHHADMAMYSVKKSIKNSHAVYSKSLHFLHDRRNEIIQKELQFAAERNELFVEYQPVFTSKTHKIISYEALLRWHHPEQGLIQPNEFIGVAEHTGCTHILSSWLVQHSLEDFKTHLSHDPKTSLSINISLSQLDDPVFLSSLCKTIEANKLSTHRIILDIAEHYMMSQFKHMTQAMQKLSNAGLKLSLDNFGTPRVALQNLVSLPLTYLKLSPHLLLGMEHSKKQRTLLKGIFSMANELKIKVIQKGIERADQDRLLTSLGCSYVQGYYYCPPLRVKDLLPYLNANSDKNFN